MAEEQSSADVAEDYRLALEDLNSINRADISTLTTIARENTEHAHAITEALQKHIIKTPAHKKLPAIYVLDSIVKNVGTPYTLFFGAQLYKTFMEAYLAVDGHVRRKMEETLRTWKQPVPQSLDDRPVFPPDVTGPIEDALNVARSSAMALQQQQASRPGYPGRPRGIGNDRATPTPPGMRPGFPIPPNHMQQQQQQQQVNGNRPGSAQPYPPRASASPYPPNAYAGQQQPGGPWQVPGQLPPGAGSGVDIGLLNRDIEDLINISRLEAERNPLDQGVQQRLKGLSDLKNLLRIQSVPQEQLVLIKKQVADLAVKVRPYTAPPVAAAPIIPPQANPSGPAAQPGSVTLDSLFGQGALSALLGRQPAGSSQVPTPTPTPTALASLLSNVPIRSPQPPPTEAPRAPSATPAPQNPMALLEGLRKAGLLAGAPPTTIPQPPPMANIPPPGMPPGIPPGIQPPGMGALPPNLLPPNLASLLSPLRNTGLSISGQIMDTIQLTAASLKNEVRSHLFPTMHEALGPQCSQCGRRFTKDEDGRKKKTAHMDWHFQVHHRLAEAERRGQHRSWYVDSADWVRSRETVDADHTREEAGTGNSGGPGGKDGSGRAAPEEKYIAVPDALAGVNTACPICQEKFENKWLDAAQEWVWLDTMLVGSRAYHVSCYSEATQARDATPARATPEPVLGKRKADDELKNLRKIKMDGS